MVFPFEAVPAPFHSGKHFDIFRKRCGQPYSLVSLSCYCSFHYYFRTLFFPLQRQFPVRQTDRFLSVSGKDFCPSAPDIPVGLLHRFCLAIPVPDSLRKIKSVFSRTARAVLTDISLLCMVSAKSLIGKNMNARPRSSTQPSFFCESLALSNKSTYSILRFHSAAPYPVKIVEMPYTAVSGYPLLETVSCVHLLPLSE